MELEREEGKRDGGGRGRASSSEWVRGPCPEVRNPVCWGFAGAARLKTWEVAWRVEGAG